MLNIPHGTTLAFDFGETRIGVAQGDAEVGIAHPLATVSGEGNDKKFAAIAARVAEWRPVQFVEGLPFSPDGSEHEMTRLARKFGHRLNGRFGLPVYWADERLTSLYAAELLNQTGLRGHKQKSVLDQVAAQAILQGFFEGGWVEEFHG